MHRKLRGLTKPYGRLARKMVRNGNTATFLRLIKAGEVMDADKGTGFGLGKFNLGEKSLVF